jgi:AcrR family transcriptional regulator
VNVTTTDAVVDVVVDLLETRGYDAVQLREVARRAHVSLATIYKRFHARDELIAAAVERWMRDNVYLSVAPRNAGESVYDGLMRMFRTVFEPWERTPLMLEAFHRARSGPGGHELEARAWQAIEPSGRAVLADGPEQYAHDVAIVLTHLAFGLISRFAQGEIASTEILPLLERAAYRLTADNRADAESARAPS